MRVVLLLSGGIDSTVLLASQIEEECECHTLTFDYGQTHRTRELQAAREIAHHYHVSNRIIPLSSIFGGSALLDSLEMPIGHAEKPDATTVPGRNLVMLSIAAAVADSIGAAAVMFGANRDDYAGYIDCQPEFVTALSEATSRGTTKGVNVYAPFLMWSKTKIVTMGKALDVPLDMTWSCYRGGDQPCNRCGACESRKAAMQ